MSDVYVSAVTGVLWIVVTPQTMLNPVPERIDSPIPGAVQPKDYRLSKPVAVCPIHDDQGRVVGASIYCAKKPS